MTAHSAALLDRTMAAEAEAGVKPLWHYTCGCGHKALSRDPVVRPLSELVAPYRLAQWAIEHPLTIDLLPLAWYTDLDFPNADALGLTMRTIPCDRTRYRYRVRVEPGRVTHRPVPYLIARHTMSRYVAAQLENAPGAMPEHWWIAREPIPVLYDPWDKR